MIKHYCDVCLGPITEAEVLGGFAVQRGKMWVHFYHEQVAQDVLKDEGYMMAIGFFIRKIKMMAEIEDITDVYAKALCKQTADEFKLEFDKLELGVRAFYSYTICEQRRVDVDKK